MIPCYLFITINQPAFLAADADFISLGDVDGGLAKMEGDLSSEGQAGMWARLWEGQGRQTLLQAAPSQLRSPPRPKHLS